MNQERDARAATRLRLEVLHLDRENPRLPAQVDETDESGLLEYIAETYDAIEVARSIARHGYFESEPLIVTKQDDGTYLVVEGNRRLVAMRILADPSLADELDDADEWRELAEAAELPVEFPAVVAVSRQDVAPIIGYRHISGIEPWEPYAKARFIASLVRDGSTFEEVSNIIGEPMTNVAAHYRNQAIVEQAREDFQIDASRVVKRFGVFTRVMSSEPLRSHIGAPAPSEVSTRRKPVPNDRQDNLRELFAWLFGDDDNDSVIRESRQITNLGVAVASEHGLAILRQTRDLEGAYIAAGGLRDRLLRRLARAHSYLDAAMEDMPSYWEDEEVQHGLARCREALEQLEKADAET